MCGVGRMKLISLNSVLTQLIPEILRFTLTRLTLDLEALGPINVGDESGEHILYVFIAGWDVLLCDVPVQACCPLLYGVFSITFGCLGASTLQEIPYLDSRGRAEL